MLKAALHLHTKEDPCDRISYTAFEAIEEAAAREFDVVAITCHNHVVDGDELRMYAERKGILYIPGIEKTIEKKHVLIINADHQAEAIETFADLAAYRQQKKDIIVIAPHAFYPYGFCLKTKLEKYAHLFDAIEYSYFHTKTLNMFNERAEQFAAQHHLPLVGNSDTHLRGHLNHTWTWIDANKNIDSVLSALRHGKTRVHAIPLRFWEMIRIYGEMWLRGMAWYCTRGPQYAWRKWNKKRGHQALTTIAKPTKTSTLQEDEKRHSISGSL